jgi:hypothetical protein
MHGLVNGLKGETFAQRRRGLGMMGMVKLVAMMSLFAGCRQFTRTFA